MAGKKGVSKQGNNPAKLNKKLLARTSGTTKGEIRGIVHGPSPRKGLMTAAKGGPTAGVAKGSKAAKRAVREVKSYLKATRISGGGKKK